MTIASKLDADVGVCGFTLQGGERRRGGLPDQGRPIRLGLWFSWVVWLADRSRPPLHHRVRRSQVELQRGAPFNLEGAAGDQSAHRQPDQDQH